MTSWSPAWQEIAYPEAGLADSRSSFWPLAAVAESLIGERLVEADLRDPDPNDQHLPTGWVFRERDRIRQLTFTAREQTITAITRRSGLQQAAIGVDTRYAPHRPLSGLPARHLLQGDFADGPSQRLC